VSSQTLRLIAIICAAQLAVAGIATAFGEAGFHSDRAFAAAFWGLEWSFAAAGFIVADHEARGRGK
jgi:hypothetical protein